MVVSQREYFIVDAFTSRALSGNPAAVLPRAGGLPDELMARIATEFNLSETTFVLPSGDGLDDEAADVRFRWFTPRIEVDLCGHATIGGIHVMVECGLLAEPQDEQSSTVVRIATRSGVLNGFVERMPGSGERMIWLDLIPAELNPASFDLTELAEALNVEAAAFDPSLSPERTPQGKAIVFVRDTMVLNGAAPNFDRLDALLRRHRLWGLSLATVNTITPSVQVQSRFFAPPAGVNEDPVTGSVHGPLAAYLVKHNRAPIVDGLAGLTCLQGIPGGRSGTVHALVQERNDGRFDVRIGGQAVTVMRGTMTLPEDQAHG